MKDLLGDYVSQSHRKDATHLLIGFFDNIMHVSFGNRDNFCLKLRDKIGRAIEWMMGTSFDT